MKIKAKIIYISLSVLLLILTIFLLLYLTWANTYKDKLLPNTYLGNTNVSEMERDEVKTLLKDKENEIRNSGIKFTYNENTVDYPLSLQASSPDIPDINLKYAESFVFEHDDTLDKIFSKEYRSFSNFLRNKLLKDKRNELSFQFTYSPNILTEWLNNTFTLANIEPQNAYFSLKKEGEQDILINNQEKIGKEIDQKVLKDSLEFELSRLSSPKISVTTKTKYPLITQVDLENLREEAERILTQDDFKIYFVELIGEKEERIEFPVNKAEKITWVSAKKENNLVSLEFDAKKISKFLNENISEAVKKEMVLPRFDIVEGKVTSWQVGKNGRELNVEATTNNILLALATNASEVEVAVNELNVDDFANENEITIRELLATGHSSFAGSPNNRRHNIKVGADAIHGLLMKPGDEFSLVETLGDIDAAAGYLPELVIKGNKTIPEYGGGLCQVATTIFRGAVNTGLPITARRNHSYRVSYYEPAGTDATVYDPWPDFRFVNDTPDYILIQARIEGDDIYFDFWGTDDGREVTVSDPVIYNITPPPPTKIIETDELAPGVKKCTERAHNGADAYFDYVVVYPEGATTTPRQEVRFNSHYVPWQEVCLVGKQKEEPIIEAENVETENITIESVVN